MFNWLAAEGLQQQAKQNYGYSPNYIQPEKGNNLEKVYTDHHDLRHQSRGKYCMPLYALQVEGHEEDTEYGAIEPGT